MIGFEKVGKRNNLKAIRSVECCQLTNSTGNVYRTSIRTIYKTGSTECHDGYFVQGEGASIKKSSAARRALLKIAAAETSSFIPHETLLNQINISCNSLISEITSFAC